MTDAQPWHRLFGLSWMDLLDGTDIEVQTELDLSAKQQLLDLMLTRPASAKLPFQLPDGFDDMATYNLITFKSYQEALDGWALCELVGHYVNLRKQYSPSLQKLVDETEFRLYAVCVRYPQQLAQEITLTPVRRGVFDTKVGTVRARIIVVHQLPEEEQNAVLHLFSARPESLQYGKEHYRPRSNETSTVLNELFRAYSEDMEMSEKLKEFARESLDRFLKSLPPEELLKRFGEALKRLPPEERVDWLPPEECLKGLTAEEVARALPPETLDELMRKYKANGSSPKPQ